MFSLGWYSVTISLHKRANRYAADFEGSIKAYERELECARETQNMPTMGRTYSNLGITHGMMKNYRKTIACHEKSLALAVQHKDKAAEGRAHGNFGISFGLLKEYGEAIKHHEARLAAAVHLRDEQGQYWALGNLCSAAKLMGDAKLAMQYWDQQQQCSFIKAKAPVLTNTTATKAAPSNENNATAAAPPATEECLASTVTTTGTAAVLPQIPLLLLLMSRLPLPLRQLLRALRLRQKQLTTPHPPPLLRLTLPRSPRLLQPPLAPSLHRMMRSLHTLLLLN